jgi:hypothetical protein
LEQLQTALEDLKHGMLQKQLDLKLEDIQELGIIQVN